MRQYVEHEKMNEIFESTELLNFDYNPNKGKKLAVVKRLMGITFVVLCIYALLPLLPVSGEAYTANAAPTATGKTTDVVNVRKGASTSTRSLGVIKKGTKLTITKEIFTSRSSTSATTRWYAVKGGGKKGYIRADLVKITSYKSSKATTTDDLNYRAGAGTSMRRNGTVSFGTKVTAYLPAKASGSSTTWYKVKVGKSNGYMSGDYLDFSNSVGKVKNKKGIAKSLLARATNGGRERFVYTFDEKNCKKKLKVTGFANGWVPQGMAYTGKQYYVLFGMGGGQSIVTYSASGKRLKATRLPYNIGKPNAMTWNPQTKLCYIFCGSQKKIYTWNPASNKFGTARTPYSSSGVSYDRKTKKIYATSLSAVRVYSSDGRFRLEKSFDRCYHSGRSYIQDCGAYGGFIFHAMSGPNKFGKNYLDVYRAKDGKYLGSIAVYLGELESVIVDNKGYIELLVNHGGSFIEYVWKTPLNVKDMM